MLRDGESDPEIRHKAYIFTGYELGSIIYTKETLLFILEVMILSLEFWSLGRWKLNMGS
jgi:hypothetical protein